MTKQVPGFEEEPGVFDIADTETDEQATREGEADFEAGRVVSHEAVVRWLRSWGAPNKLPRPRCGE